MSDDFDPFGGAMDPDAPLPTPPPPPAPPPMPDGVAAVLSRGAHRCDACKTGTCWIHGAGGVQQPAVLAPPPKPAIELEDREFDAFVDKQSMDAFFEPDADGNIF